MNRPYVICHMLTSIDGKVTGDFLRNEKCKDATEIYYEMNRSISCEAFACGRVTMQESFTGNYYPDLSKYSTEELPKEDFVNISPNNKYAVSFDRLGRVGWRTNEIIDEDPGYGGHYIIEVLTGNVPNEYLRYLKKMKISYIFAGIDDIDINKALEKLYRLFKIKTLLLEGGSIINGAFFMSNAVDELSLVVAPLIGDSCDKPLFMESALTEYILKECVKYKEVIYLNYIKLDK